MIAAAVRATLAVMLIWALCACASTDNAAPVVASVSATDAPVLTMPVMTAEAGRSVEERPIETWTIGTGDVVVLIIASIHGDEAAGTPLLARLADELATRPDVMAGRTVVLVPQANPDGIAARRRTNVNGVDLNRNFPASNYAQRPRNGHGPLSEPESRALHDLVEALEPDRVISIHQPLRCLDYDGPGRTLAEAMGAACDLPVRRLGARPGSLGSWVGEELGIAIVTVELPGAASRWSDRRLWNRYGPMLLAAVEFESP